MANTYPFHYEVRIKLFAIDKNNNVRNETFTRTFNDLSPLQNRDNAFGDRLAILFDLEMSEFIMRPGAVIPMSPPNSQYSFQTTHIFTYLSVANTPGNPPASHPCTDTVRQDRRRGGSGGM